MEGIFLRPGSSRDCGDSPFSFDLKAKGVSCSKAREVARRWVEKSGGAVEQLVKVGRFRCRGKGTGESSVITCKRKRPRATVKFGRGG